MRAKSTHLRIGFVTALVIGLSVTALRSAFPAFYSNQDVLDERMFAPFLRELQRAVARNDRQAVAAQVHYPLIVLAGDIRIPIADAAALIQTYDVVFSPALKAVLAQASLAGRGRAAPKHPVIVAGDLASVDQVIDIRLVGGALKVTRISAPLAAPSTTIDRPSVPSRGDGNTAEPRRLVLQVGQARLSGALAPGARDAYVVSATKNQLLEVRIDGVSGRDIVARLADVKSRAPLDARARDGVRTWTGRVPEDGDYRIDVVRLGLAGQPRLPYVIVINMR